MACVELRNLWKRYGPVEAVRDLTLTIGDGELLALLGPSGCGKTSTLKMIAGIEPVTQGDILFDGRGVGHLAPGARNIAMVFEDYALYPRRTARDNLAFPLEVRRLPAREVRARIERAAAMLHLGVLLPKRVEELSGGQQQRVAIGRALVREPEVLLLDEPLSHLDAELKTDLRAEMKRLQRETGVTAVLVTHDQLEAMAMASRIAIMDRGVLQQVGTPEAIYRRPVNLFVAGFVGEPPMNILRCALAEEAGSLALAAPGWRMTLPPATAASLRGAGAPARLLLGLRPEDVRASPAGVGAAAARAGTGIPGRLFFRESRGDETVFLVRVGADLVSATTTAPPEIALDEAVAVRFDLEAAHFFDPGTGENLLARDGVEEGG